MKKYYLIGLAAITALLFNGCKAKVQTADTSGKLLVKTAPARSEKIGQIAEFTGNIEPYVENNICPSLAVRIDEILVDVGDKVKKGQLLVIMDKNQYNQAAVQLANLEADFARNFNVYEAGGISKQQIDQLQTQIDVMRENVDNLKKNIELRSPIDGIVTGRYNEAGDMFSMTPNASGSASILQVMQINPLKVLVDISEQYFPLVEQGMPARIDVDIFPDLKFTGNVSLIYPAINSTTRTFTVEVTIPNNYLTLRPGMYCRTIFNFGEKEGVTVNDLAVQKQVGSNEKYLYVIKDGIAERRTVTTGRQLGDRIQILSGVTPGEEVVIAGISRLKDGSEVEIQNKE